MLGLSDSVHHSSSPVPFCPCPFLSLSHWMWLLLLHWGSVPSVHMAGIVCSWALKAHKSPNLTLVQVSCWQCRGRQCCSRAVLGEGPGGAAVPGRKPFVCEARKQGGFGDGNPMQLLTDFSQLLIQERLCLLPAFLCARLPSSLC